MNVKKISAAFGDAAAVAAGSQPSVPRTLPPRRGRLGANIGIGGSVQDGRAFTAS